MKIFLRNRGASVDSRRAESNKQGFVLVEVIVAMVLLAVAVSSLAALMYSVNQSAMRTTGDAYRNGVLMQEVNRLEGIPYDSIPTGTTSTVVSGGTYPHTRTVVVVEPVTGVVKTIRVVVAPTNPRYKPDTASFTRTRARTTHVLCTTCP